MWYVAVYVQKWFSTAGVELNTLGGILVPYMKDSAFEILNVKWRKRRKNESRKKEKTTNSLRLSWKKKKILYFDYMFS